MKRKGSDYFRPQQYAKFFLFLLLLDAFQMDPTADFHMNPHFGTFSPERLFQSLVAALSVSAVLTLIYVVLRKKEKSSGD